MTPEERREQEIKFTLIIEESLTILKDIIQDERDRIDRNDQTLNGE